MAFFHLEVTRIKRQVVVETEGALPDATSDDNILQTEHKAMEAEGLRFQCVTQSLRGNS